LSTRQEMLQRIRQALALPQGQTSTPSDLAALPDLGAVLPPIEPADLVTRFEQELTKVGASAHRIQSSETGRLLSQVLKVERADGVALSRNPLLARLDLEGVCKDIGVPAWTWPTGTSNDAGSTFGAAAHYRERCFSAAAGVTGVDFALAESGTLVLSSLTEGAQLSSLAPPIHIAFYLRHQVAGALEEVLEGLRVLNPSPGRSVVLITGTSRTADIEQILIRGVHGPRELHAVLIEDW
jgi:L-lactate dehydrogenase complex protein LldG